MFIIKFFGVSYALILFFLHLQLTYHLRMTSAASSLLHITTYVLVSSEDVSNSLRLYNMLLSLTQKHFYSAGIKDIIQALQGNTAGIAERGIALKSGTPAYTPGKIDASKAIYGTDGQGGGCSIFKTNDCILIVYYKSEPAAATRLASEVAEYMRDQGH